MAKINQPPVPAAGILPLPGRNILYPLTFLQNALPTNLTLSPSGNLFSTVPTSLS
ncbi:MAG: hypothetical protein P8184_08335 [Calditrichia bacterium]